MRYTPSSIQRQECIQHCLDCYRTCLDTVTGYCLERGGEHAEPHHVRLMLDCAEFCRVSADAMIRHSELHGQVCGICAQVCERCANECDHFDDEPMRACADTCRHCATTCAEMAGAMA